MPTSVVCLKRSRGAIVVDCDVYIGRRLSMGGWNLAQSEWHNPFKGDDAVYRYYKWLMQDAQKELRERGVRKLKGKVLGCFCLGKKRAWLSCHGEVWQWLCDGVLPIELKQVLAEHEDKDADLETREINWRLYKKKLSPLGVEDRLLGMFNSAFMGDALGMCHEFARNKRVSFSPRLEVGYTHRNWRTNVTTTYAPGQVTDDSEMMLILAQHLVTFRGSLDAPALAKEYLAWANSGQNFLGRNTRDLFYGVTTLKGYRNRYEAKFGFPPPLNEEPTLTSDQAEFQLSNGALMRAASLALLPHNGYLYRDIYLTNPSVAAEEMECDYVDALRMALRGETAATILAFFFRKKPASPDYAALLADLEHGVKRKLTNIKEGSILVEGKGSIMSAMYATLWCLWWYVHKHKPGTKGKKRSQPTYLELIEALVVDFPGSDTDTNACIMGALLGAIIGANALDSEPDYRHNLKVIYTYPQTGDRPRPLKYHPVLLYELLPKLARLYHKLN